jgi:ATP-dependent RNA helicase DeaD
MQVAKEIGKITAQMDVTVVPVYGGAPINPQIKQLEDGAQIVAGTPGRVLDHIRRKTLDTSGISMLVLDECDEMLSMGFQEEIENIINTLPAKDIRQTLLFSATIPKEIERIGRRHMREPEMVSLSSDSVGADLIDHYYYVVSGMARTRDLLKLMKSERPESALIFCNTREETSTVARYLVRHGYDAEHLSSDLSQSDRERVMARMKAKNLNFLVATDIAARGIDISQLSHVINYTFPGSPEVYVHRSGRTGRAGAKGTALSLVGPREIGAFYYLKLIYKIIPTERDLPTAEEMATIEEGEQYQNIVKQVEGTPKSEFVGLAKRLWQSNEGERVVALLLQEFVTKKPAERAKASVAESAAPAAKSAEPQESTEPARGEDRKRRRRRRGNSEEETSSESRTSSPMSAESVPEAAAAPAIEVAPEAPLPQSAIETPAIEDELSAEPEAPKRPKRKRRRRSASSEETAAEESVTVESDAEETVLEASPDADSEDATEATASAEEKDPDTAEAVHEALKADDDTAAKPARKRRRRGAKTEEKVEASAAEEAPATEKAEAKSEPVKAKANSRKRRDPKPSADPGAHGEFWEAWAETKDSDDDSAADPKEASVEAEATEEKAAPEKKRRSRKRRRGKEAEVEEEDGDAEDQSDSVRLFVNVGRREDADADEIRAFLVEALGDDGDQLGKITLRNTHCYIRVPEAIVDGLIEACTGLVFHEREMVVERAKR